MYFGPAYTMIEAARLTSDCHQVIAMRLQGLAQMKGGLSDTQTETSRMVFEKPASFLKAWAAGSEAIFRGETPDAVMRAYIEPLSMTAAANRKRLAGRASAIAK